MYVYVKQEVVISNDIKYAVLVANVFVGENAVIELNDPI